MSTYNEDFINHFAEALKDKQASKNSRSKSMKNSFTGARIHRLSADQPTYRYSVDYDLRIALPVLVARSRHLWQNNAYAKRFFRMLKTHVVGPFGVIYQNKALKPGGEELDSNTNRMIEKNVNEWGKSGNCDVTGKLSLIDAQNLYIQTMAQDGEVLIREIKGFDNKWGYALQFIDTDCLDFNLNRILPNGNVIKMGVELDKWNRPVNYWILQRHPGEYQQRPIQKQWEVIPASEIIHDFEPERTNQTRGIPWMHAVMINLAMLGGALEAEVVAFRASASKMGLITEPAGEPLEGNDDQEEDNGAGDYDVVFDAEAGTFIKLPKGYEASFYDPKHPNSTVNEFAKTILKGTASGLGPSYPSLASDLEGVNYTSIRAGFLDERDFFKYLQYSFLIDRFCSRIIRNQTQMSILTGALKTPYAQFDRIYAPKFQPRTWDWVDPLKEVASDVAEINAGLTTRSAEAAKRGLDFEEDILQVLAAEKKLQDKYGIIFKDIKVTTSPASAANEEMITVDTGAGSNNGGNGNGSE